MPALTFPLPESHQHATHAKWVKANAPATATLAQTPATWSGSFNNTWAMPLDVNAWTALLLSAYNGNNAALREVEVRLALDGLPPPGVGEINDRGVLWLLAWHHTKAYVPADDLWAAVRGTLNQVEDAHAALQVAERLVGTPAYDPWGLKAACFTNIFAAWRKGGLGTPEQDDAVLRFLRGPIAIWKNTDVIHQVLAFAAPLAQLPPTDQLQSLSRWLSAAPDDIWSIWSESARQMVRDRFERWVEQGAQIRPEDPFTAPLLSRWAPDLLAGLRQNTLRMENAPTEKSSVQRPRRARS